MRVAAVGSRVLLSLSAVLLLASCSTFLGHEFDELSASEQEASFGTQAGFHRLSPYFAVAVGGGSAGTDRLMQFYYYENGTSRRHLIGTIQAVTFESADYGPRNQHFALSSDGERLLYFHEAKYGYGALKKADGLYLARADGTEVLVRGAGERVISDKEIATYLGK
jgi:hypothetical protein